jgi:hypothetical protein
MDRKEKPNPNSVQMVKVASRILFSGRPTKVKPSKKIYSRKKKDLSGVDFSLIPNSTYL